MVGMARGAPSPADLQVVRELAVRQVVVTVSQLESWRHAGLLPRHRRRGLGRGLGSVVDAVDPVVVECAAALARHLRQGRDRRLAVLEWFAEAGMPVRPGAVQVPEPPIGVVRWALVWVLERSVSQRLVEFARSAAGAGEEGQDALYAVAGRLVGPYRGAANPALVRAALEAGEDVPVEAERPDFRSMVHLVAAIGLGAQEVGADALAEAFAAFGIYGLTVQDWAQMLGAAERGEGPPMDWRLLCRPGRTPLPVGLLRAGPAAADAVASLGARPSEVRPVRPLADVVVRSRAVSRARRCPRRTGVRQSG